MRRIFLFPVLLFAALALFPLSNSQLPAQEQGASTAQRTDSAAKPVAYGEKLKLDGIHNSGKINEVLYRGAQPKNAVALSALKELGITTIVDLRGEGPDRIAWERRQTELLGMRFVQIPVSGWSPPKDEQVAQFLSLFRRDSPQKVFVHCRFGDDRTGVFVATYRMAVDKWSPEQAMNEMYFFGFNGFWHPQMKNFIREFPDHLKSSPFLTSLRTQTAIP